MLFLNHDAAAHANAHNGLFGADAVVIGERVGIREDACLKRVVQPVLPRRQPTAYPTAQSAADTARSPLSTVTSTPAVPAAVRRMDGPAARVWASWVVSQAALA